FQAEDGIRDKLVTGVQTCALPIFGRKAFDGHKVALPERGSMDLQELIPGADTPLGTWVKAVDPEDSLNRVPRDRLDAELLQFTRSEERRVGKECRSRWSKYH